MISKKIALPILAIVLLAPLSIEATIPKLKPEVTQSIVLLEQPMQPLPLQRTRWERIVNYTFDKGDTILFKIPATLGVAAAAATLVKGDTPTNAATVGLLTLAGSFATSFFIYFGITESLD